MLETILPSIASAGFDYLGAKQTQRWEKQAASRQMDFQERMSNTAYQRAMSDMAKAGINPIMVTKLGGASTPTGAKASSPDLGKIGSNAINASNAYQQAKVNKITADTKEMDYENMKARGLSPSILSANPISLLINGLLNEAAKGNLANVVNNPVFLKILNQLGIKDADASATGNKTKDLSNDINNLKKLIKSADKGYRSSKDHPTQRNRRSYDRSQDHPSQRGRK